MRSIPTSTCRLTVSAMADVTCAAMTAGFVISALASHPGMSSQPLGGGSRPTCVVLIRVMLLCMFPSSPVPAFDLPHVNTIEMTIERLQLRPPRRRWRSWPRPGFRIRAASTAPATSRRAVSAGYPHFIARFTGERLVAAKAIARWCLPDEAGNLWLIVQHFAEPTGSTFDVSTAPRPAAASRLTRSLGIASAPVVPAAATSSAQHFFDRRDPAGRGGIFSGIPLAPRPQRPDGRLPPCGVPSRHADLTAVDLVGESCPHSFLAGSDRGGSASAAHSARPPR
jgi:hypothetical protein